MKQYRIRSILTGTAFLGSFLLFCLEPYIGRKLTPLFGGSTQVWLVCLAAYQLLILAGYCYAHVVSAKMYRLHLFGLAVPLMILPVGMFIIFPPQNYSYARIVLIALGLAVPFVLLAATTVILQQWFSRSGESGEPYSLYGASNAGALTALVGYSFFIEPLAGLKYQAILWMTVYLLYVLIVVFSFHFSRPPISGNPITGKQYYAGTAADNPLRRKFLRWMLLSGSASAFLVAVTNITTSEIGSFPLVWMAPLSLYLMSFIVAFRPTCKAELLFSRFWPETMLFGVVLFLIGSGRVWTHLGHWAVFFAGCVMLHRALYEERPHPQLLSIFYIAIALGGSAGGLIVSLAAPLVFPGFWEYPLLVAVMSILFIRRYGRTMMSLRWRSSRLALTAHFISILFLIGLSVMLGITASVEDTKITERNYYGISRVIDAPVADTQRDIVRILISGSTVHGIQFRDKLKKDIPTLYYHPGSGLTDIFKIIPSDAHIAAIGLGVGTIGAYTRRFDLLDIYELNPQVVTLARQWFTYLALAPTRIRVMIGDGRLALQNQDIFYDLIFVDAFSGEGIPSHLLTREAIETYLHRLNEHGVILFHITNRYYDLHPVLKAAASSLKLHSATKITETMLGEAAKPVRADYLALTSDSLISQRLTNLGWINADRMVTAINCRVWTDDYINMLVPLAAKWSLLSRK